MSKVCDLFLYAEFETYIPHSNIVASNYTFTSRHEQSYMMKSNRMVFEYIIHHVVLLTHPCAITVLKLLF